jgi:hypothetical protein
MKKWTTLAGVVFLAGFLAVAGCKKEKEAAKPPPPDPLTACKNDASIRQRKMNKIIDN